MIITGWVVQVVVAAEWYHVAEHIAGRENVLATEPRDGKHQKGHRM